MSGKTIQNSKLRNSLQINFGMQKKYWSSHTSIHLSVTDTKEKYETLMDSGQKILSEVL